jgi:hypothetical protein
VLELRELLIAFEAAYRSGGALPPPAEAALKEKVREISFREFSVHANEVPIWRKDTGWVVWMKEEAIRAYRSVSPRRDRNDDSMEPSDAEDRSIADRFDSDNPDERLKRLFDLCATCAPFERYLATLDRMLVDGARGGRARLASEVRRRLDKGQADFDADQLVADTFKHAYFDEVKFHVERIENKRQPRAKPTPKRPRKLDHLVFCIPADGLARARENCPEALAFCVAHNYAHGGIDRALCQPFSDLALGTGRVGDVLDAVDGIFASAVAAPKGARRKDLRQKGIGDRALAQILGGQGVALNANSIPKVYERRRSLCKTAAALARRVP